jgi:hypothetical protein
MVYRAEPVQASGFAGLYVDSETLKYAQNVGYGPGLIRI